MSYESEERYWTDYLRVALPVIGLLLMLALFWWWAQNFIGDENDPEQVANIVQTQVATQAPPTATATVAITVEATEVENTPADDGNGDGGNTSLSNTPTGDQPTEADCGFAEGDRVVTTDEVRMRSEPSTASDENIIESLPAGTELRIIGNCYETDGDVDFWHVTVRETAEEGYVAADYIEAEE